MQSVDNYGNIAMRILVSQNKTSVPTDTVPNHVYTCIFCRFSLVVISNFI